MDRLFDRLGGLVRSLLGDSTRRRPDAASRYDPDMQEAWEELDGYLRGEERKPRQQPEWDPRLAAREHLRQDYANLEVSFGAPLDEVHRSYKRLLVMYHPDKNAGDARRQQMATEITQKINASFHRIRDFEEKSGVV